MLQNALHLSQIARELEDYNTGKDFLNPKGGSEVTHDMTRKWKVMQGLQVIFLTCCIDLQCLITLCKHIQLSIPVLRHLLRSKFPWLLAWSLRDDVAFMSWSDAGS